MIRSFACKDTAALHRGEPQRRLPSTIAAAARRKLSMLEAAVSLDDLRSPPGNRLEALVGNLAGRHSVRVNEQWRLCFRWSDGGADDVEIVDYH